MSYQYMLTSWAQKRMAMGWCPGWGHPLICRALCHSWLAPNCAGASLHTMVIMQMYQADLFRDLDEGKRVGPNNIKEFCQANNFSQCHWGDGQSHRPLHGSTGGNSEFMVNLLGIKEGSTIPPWCPAVTFWPLRQCNALGPVGLLPESSTSCQTPAPHIAKTRKRVLLLEPPLKEAGGWEGENGSEDHFSLKKGFREEVLVPDGLVLSPSQNALMQHCSSEIPGHLCAKPYRRLIDSSPVTRDGDLT